MRNDFIAAMITHARIRADAVAMLVFLRNRIIINIRKFRALGKLLQLNPKTEIHVDPSRNLTPRQRAAAWHMPGPTGF